VKLQIDDRTNSNFKNWARGPVATVQNLAALIIVLAACAYLAWRGWAFFAARKQAAGCGSGCGSCPVSGGAAESSKPLVMIEPLAKNSLTRNAR
jgi:hypothetical protein